MPKLNQTFIDWKRAAMHEVGRATKRFIQQTVHSPQVALERFVERKIPIKPLQKGEWREETNPSYLG